MKRQRQSLDLLIHFFLFPAHEKTPDPPGRGAGEERTRPVPPCALPENHGLSLPPADAQGQPDCLSAWKCFSKTSGGQNGP